MLKAMNESDYADCDSLIVTAYANLAEAVNQLRSAQNCDQTKELRAAAKAQAVDELDCLKAHFEGALGLIPDE